MYGAFINFRLIMLRSQNINAQLTLPIPLIDEETAIQGGQVRSVLGDDARVQLGPKLSSPGL